MEIHSEGASSHGADGNHYFYPVWRFGRVLQAPDGQVLPVSQALEMGELFTARGASAERYFGSRMERLRILAVDSCSKVVSDKESIRECDPASTVVGQSVSRQIRVSYSFVPIIAFPEFTLVQGAAIWSVREAITVCGTPSKSKIWLRASLTAWQGRPTDQEPLSSTDLETARTSFGTFAEGALDSLVDFYRSVLREDVRTLSMENRVQIDDLRSFAEVEIIGLTMIVDLDAAFDELEEQGYSVFRSRVKAGVPGTSEVLDFMHWADKLPCRAPGDWKSNRPKMLDLFSYVPHEDSVRALVLPKEKTDQRRAWYGLIGERFKRPHGQGFLFTGDHAARIIAQEYGRCF